MECKEFISLIPDWLDDNLRGKDADRFMQHMDTCAECSEELHIQFLIKEGISRLESGAGFNLNKELNAKMSDYRKTLHNEKTGNYVVYAMEVISALIIAFILILVFIYK